MNNPEPVEVAMRLAEKFAAGDQSATDENYPELRKYYYDSILAAINATLAPSVTPKLREVLEYYACHRDLNELQRSHANELLKTLGEPDAPSNHVEHVRQKSLNAIRDRLIKEAVECTTLLQNADRNGKYLIAHENEIRRSVWLLASDWVLELLSEHGGSSSGSGSPKAAEIKDLCQRLQSAEREMGEASQKLAEAGFPSARQDGEEVQEIRLPEQNDNALTSLRCLSSATSEKKEAVAESVNSAPQTTLLPCPHCGDVPTLRGREGKWKIECEDMCFNFCTAGSKDRDSLARMWNRRSPSVSVSDETKQEIARDAAIKLYHSLPRGPGINENAKIILTAINKALALEKTEAASDSGEAKTDLGNETLTPSTQGADQTQQCPNPELVAAASGARQLIYDLLFAGKKVDRSWNEMTDVLNGLIRALNAPSGVQRIEEEKTEADLGDKRAARTKDSQ